MSNNKTTLRQQYLKLRQNFALQTQSQAQVVINTRFFDFIHHQTVQSLALYVSKDQEVATIAMIKYALEHSIVVYLPKVNLDKTMDFYQITNFETDLSFNSTLKIWEPIPSKTSLLTAKTSPDAYFLPLVCFDDDLNRIGFGQGYYDRYFSGWNYQGLVVGLAFEQQHTSQLIDTESFDFPLDFVISEKQVYTAKVKKI